jgi:hypothetical protein
VPSVETQLPLSWPQIVDIGEEPQEYHPAIRDPSKSLPYGRATTIPKQ